MIRSKSTFIYLLQIITALIPYTLKGQLIAEKFDRLSISENFDSINTYWTTLANSENLFIVQEGEYILQRKAPVAPYAIIANFEEDFNDFRIVTSMKLEKTFSDDATLGILFMMQRDGQGGFLCEYNKNKQYRIRQIVNGSYRYVTGVSKDGGWIKSNHLNEVNSSNMMEIRCFKKNYDLYINNNYIQSFTEPNYYSGRMGLIIGPGSRGKVDFMYVFTRSGTAETNASNPLDKPLVKGGEPDIIELAESIITLKTQINKLNEENEGLRKSLSAMKSEDQDRDVTIRNYEKQVKNLEEEIRKGAVSKDSLMKINTDLLKYKELVGGNENADLIITLSRALKAEKEKNTQLQKEIQELKNDNTSPKSNPKGSVKPVVTPKKDQSGNTQGNNGTFSLPKN